MVPIPIALLERGLRTRNGATAVSARGREGFTHVGVRRSVSRRTSGAIARSSLAGSGLTPLFPLFGADTRHAALAREMIAARPARAHHLREPGSDRPLGSPAASSTRRCSTSCRRRSIRAASAASFTPSRTPARCSTDPDRRSETGVTVERDGFVFMPTVCAYTPSASSA